jgi:hypothetical protein
MSPNAAKTQPLFHLIVQVPHTDRSQKDRLLICYQCSIPW